LDIAVLPLSWIEPTNNETPAADGLWQKNWLDRAETRGRVEGGRRDVKTRGRGDTERCETERQ